MAGRHPGLCSMQPCLCRQEQCCDISNIDRLQHFNICRLHHTVISDIGRLFAICWVGLDRFCLTNSNQYPDSLTDNVKIRADADMEYRDRVIKQVIQHPNLHVYLCCGVVGTKIPANGNSVCNLSLSTLCYHCSSSALCN